MKSPRILQLLILLTLALFVAEAGARGFRGGGGRGGGRPTARPSRPSSRPAPVRQPTPSRLPERKPTQHNQAINRSPSLSDRSRPSNAAHTAQRQQAKNRAMANPKLRPLFEGDPTTRKARANKRLGSVIRDAPGRETRPSRPSAGGSIAEARLKGQATRAAAVGKNIAPTRRHSFNRDWVQRKRPLYPQRWHYWHCNHPVSWWWRWATWATVTRWVTYNWSTAYYYDYGGSDYYEDEVVYIDDEPVASYEDYVASAEDLATVPDPSGDEEMDWEPLGTWALSSDRDQTSSNMMLQMVLSKDGHLSGTYYNTTTDNTQRLRGSIDKESQRIAFTIGEVTTTILEVGLENLTRDETPVWVHFTKTDTTQTWLLVRLKPDES